MYQHHLKYRAKDIKNIFKVRTQSDCIIQAAKVKDSCNRKTLHQIFHTLGTTDMHLVVVVNEEADYTTYLRAQV